MTPTILHGDCRDTLKTIPAGTVQCCVTSPPYWGLRDYGVDGQMGFERTPREYIAHMTDVFEEVRRVLRDDGTLFLNLGDSYMAHPGQRKETDTGICGSERGGRPAGINQQVPDRRAAGRGKGNAGSCQGQGNRGT
jgi:hypothetical protein